MLCLGFALAFNEENHFDSSLKLLPSEKTNKLKTLNMFVIDDLFKSSDY